MKFGTGLSFTAMKNDASYIRDFARKLEELYKQDPNLKGIVLDLRNDPGGLLEGAVAVSAAFGS